MTVALLTILNQMYLIYNQPFLSRLDNHMAITNDLLISLYLHGYIVLSDFNEHGQWREEASFFLLSVLFTSIFLGLV